jgi:hypothetical protein
MELTKEKEIYCDESPISMQFTFEEHEALCDAISQAMDCYNLISYADLEKLPRDCETRKKYELLDTLRNRVYYGWSQRFEVSKND